MGSVGGVLASLGSFASPLVLDVGAGVVLCRTNESAVALAGNMGIKYLSGLLAASILSIMSCASIRVHYEHM